MASHLIERGRRLPEGKASAGVVRARNSTPSKIHIRNLYRAADAGATIFPLIPRTLPPGHARPDGTRVRLPRARHIGLPQPDAYRWKG
jgi:hypothetical protein